MTNIAMTRAVCMFVIVSPSDKFGNNSIMLVIIQFGLYRIVWLVELFNFHENMLYMKACGR